LAASGDSTRSARLSKSQHTLGGRSKVRSRFSETTQGDVEVANWKMTEHNLFDQLSLDVSAYKASINDLYDVLAQVTSDSLFH
jgi:hypothetical protein